MIEALAVGAVGGFGWGLIGGFVLAAMMCAAQQKRTAESDSAAESTEDRSSKCQ